VRRRILAIAAAAALAPGCGSCGKPSPGVTVEAGVSTPPPVPAPDGVIAQAWVRAPDALWARVQAGVSGAAGLLPADVGSLLCAATGLDAAVGPLVDGKAGAYVVVADGSGAAGSALAWAAAVPLEDGPRVASLLLLPPDASAPRYTSRDEQGMRVLTRTGHPMPVSVALAQGWLVVARTDADLARLGPYAWRTMPTLPAPAGTASVVAVLAQKALASRAGAQWDQAREWLAARDREERQRHGGRAPDFGDPQAILDAVDVVVKRRVALLAGARSATLEIEAGDDDVRADLRLEADADAGAGDDGGLTASMAPGDARPLGELPGDAVLALMVRDRPEARADDARELEAALARALGARAHADDNRAVAAAVDAWAAGRGDWLAASLAWAPSRAVTLRSAGGDGAARALRGLLELAGRPVFAAPLHDAFGSAAPTFATARVEGLPGASLATFGGKSTPGVAWGVRGDQLFAAAGEHADRRLAAQLTAPHLADDPRVSQALTALGSDASLVLLAEPLRLDPSRAASEAARSPAVIAWGRQGGGAWLRVDVGDDLLREVVRLQAGL
jgi:hypothetical protein